MSRRLAASALLGAVALLAASLAGCGGAASTALTGQPISLEQLSRSAGTSEEVSSARFAFDARTELPGARAPLAFSGTGAFDRSAGRAAFSIDLSAFAKLLGGLVSAMGGSKAKGPPSLDDPAGWKIDVVQDGNVGYVRFPALADRLPAGKSWIRGEGKSIEAGGFQLKQLQQYPGTDPRSLLDVLKAAAGKVDTVGTEELRGEPVTHYRATIDPGKYEKVAAASPAGRSSPLAQQLASGAGAGRVPVDVWLDADGRVRKLVLSVTADGSASSVSARASTSLELWDYGEHLAIDVPPADSVVDASALRP